MSRIDIQTLVLAFEKRIEALEKNPPDKVPMSVMINLLERSIDDCIKEHFINQSWKNIRQELETVFKINHKKFIKKCIKNILDDVVFRENIERELKNNMLRAIK